MELYKSDLVLFVKERRFNHKLMGWTVKLKAGHLGDLCQFFYLGYGNNNDREDMYPDAGPVIEYAKALATVLELSEMPVDDDSGETLAVWKYISP